MKNFLQVVAAFSSETIAKESKMGSILVICVVVGLILGILIVIPLLFTVIGGALWAQKFARQAIKDEKIPDLKRVEAALKLLNISQDSESKHLWQKLNELKEKSEKAS